MQQHFLLQALNKDPRESKLPLWVREKFATLRQAAADSSTELTALKSGTKQSNLWLENWDGQERFYLPRHRLIYKTDHSFLEIRGASGDGDKGLLTIYSLDGGLVVYPESSNVVSLKSARFQP